METMSNDEFRDKLNEYSDRNSFWTDKAITQLGYSINLFTTVSITLLGYIVVNRDEFPNFDFTCGSELSIVLIFYIFSIMFLGLSVFLGFVSILSRLLDFRITRYLALTRKRFLSKNKKRVLEENRLIGLIDCPLIDISNERKYPIFMKHVTGKAQFIVENDLDYPTLVKDKFMVLHKESKILGECTWKCHKYQIVFLLLGAIMYCLTIIK